MNTEQAVLVLRKVHAYRPAQLVDSLTGHAWAEALDDIRFEDAQQAVTEIAKRSSDWIDPAKIRGEVKRIRETRIKEHGEPIPPAGLDLNEYLGWLQDARRRIGDGQEYVGEVWREPDHEEAFIRAAEKRERWALGGVA